MDNGQQQPSASEYCPECKRDYLTSEESHSVLEKPAMNGKNICVIIRKPNPQT